MAKIENPDVSTAELPEQRHSKQQLMTSKKYAHRRDLLGALLADGETYSVGEADELIKNYDEGEM